jgi:hypothetical protein
MSDGVIVEMMWMGATKQDKLATLKQVRAAGDRIGFGSRAQLIWALKFSNEDLSTLSPGRCLDLQLELAAFRCDTSLFGELPDSVKVPIKRGYFPSPAEVKRTRERFTAALDSYARQSEIIISHQGKVDFHLTERGNFVFEVPDSVTGCVIRLMKLIGEFPQHVRRCASVECGKWFLAKKTDATYCSKTCGTRERTRELRRRKAEEKAREHGTRKAR